MRNIVKYSLMMAFMMSGSALADDTFTFSATIPVINAVFPNIGPQGTQVEVLGSNFTGATAVAFGNAPVAMGNFTVVNDNKITATAPAHSLVKVSVIVTTPAGTSVPSIPPN